MLNLDETLLINNSYVVQRDLYLRAIAYACGIVIFVDIVRGQISEVNLLQLIPGLYLVLLFISFLFLVYFSDLWLLIPFKLDNDKGCFITGEPGTGKTYMCKGLQNELLNLYHQHDIFIHPTMLEAGHPNLTMVEAAAAGLPIIADWELETNFHGAWRAPRDIFEMNVGLQDVMKNFEFYKSKALETAKELDWYNRTTELIKLYERSFEENI